VLADELKDLLDVFLEALLQHLICLVKASYLQVGQLDGAPLQQVNQPTGRRHDNVAPVSDLPHLLVDVTAPVHRHHLEIAPHAQGRDLVLHLDCQLNRKNITSRVGSTIRNLTLPPSLKASMLRKRSMTGREKARVLPEPVRSRAMRSFPLKMWSKV
jgi:hypothetical protein